MVRMLGFINTYTIVAYSPTPSEISFIWAMKTVPTDTNKAVPSMLTVAPMGSTKREIRGSTPHLSFMHRKVIGSVAALRKEMLLVCALESWQCEAARVQARWAQVPPAAAQCEKGRAQTRKRNPMICPAWWATLVQGLANIITFTHPHRPGTGTTSETNKQTRLLCMSDSDWEWGGYSVMGAGVTGGWGGPERLQHKREPLTQPADTHCSTPQPGVDSLLQMWLEC